MLWLIYSKPFPFMPVTRIDKSRFYSREYQFNCAIAKYKGELLLAYRRDVEKRHAELRICELDSGYQPFIETDRKIEVPAPLSGKGIRAEDPRLFTFKKKLYCAFSNIPGGFGPSSQGIALLDKNYQPEKIWYPKYGYNYNASLLPTTREQLPCGAIVCKTPSGIAEKNWQFFEYRGKLHFVYSINPHLVCVLGDDMTTVKKEYTRRWKTSWDKGE